ncbi:hypothetical protein ACFSW8_15800 [Rubritalea tangerina]|uniref:Oxidoreductase n=1 Tax=Rubritalea tangerina TaxID=430798 RepID=A0ABW4ZEW1_9BACT
MPHTHTLSLEPYRDIKYVGTVSDFIISDKPLREEFKISDPCTLISDRPIEYNLRILRWFMLEEICEELYGRLPLYVCSYCGDFDCGYHSVEIQEQDDLVIWSDFRWNQSTYDDISEQTDSQKYFTRKFDREQYMKVFRDQKNTLETALA